SSDKIEELCDDLVRLRERSGRLFVIGIGGSAANCSHAVSDFRKLCGIDAYAPTDNLPEILARTNDEGWHSIFSEWLKVANACEKDCLMIFSVGGGSIEANVSTNLIAAINEAKLRGLRILGIVGRDGGYTRKNADVVVVVPTVEPSRITPHAES